MPNAASLAALASLDLIQGVDDKRAATDLLKLPGFLREAVDTHFATLETADNATALTESDRTGGSGKARSALTALEALLRDGYNGIKGIPSVNIKAEDRLALFTAYGWLRGQIGKFSDARVLGLARLAVSAEVMAKVPEARRYHADVLAGLIAQLKEYEDNQADATGGDRQEATKVRDKALNDAETTLVRVRFYYCCASVDADQTPELAMIGFQPRRDAQPSKPATPPKTPAPTP